MLTKVFSILLLIAPALALPRAFAIAAMKASDDASYGWTMSSWVASYGGTYSFNISGEYSADAFAFPIPAFKAFCTGNSAPAPDANDYHLCDITDLRNTTKRRQVVAKMTTATNASHAAIAVSYRFDDLTQSNAWWNYTSYATQPFKANSTLFMEPSELYGVA